MVFPHEVLVQLRLTGEVEVTDVTVEVGVAAGALTRLRFLIRRCTFLRDHILRVTAPAQEEVSNILVVSLSLIVHLGLYRRGGLTPAQLTVEGLTLGHELSWHQRVPAINPAGVVTVGPGGEQLRGQPLPLDPGNRGPDVRPFTDGGVAGPGLVVHRTGRGHHRVKSVLGVVTVLARPHGADHCRWFGGWGC